MPDRSHLADSAKEEIGFWERELTLQGKHPDDIARRLDRARRGECFPPLLRDPILPMLVARFGLSGPARCIEVGSGPLSTLAAAVDAGQLEVTAIDVLAELYAELRARHHFADFPIHPLPGSGEDLADRFPAGSFHLAYACNSLDHHDDAPRVFDNLVRLTATDGAIVLQHHLEEGSHREWSPSHKWNLSLDARGLAATDRSGRTWRLGDRDDLELVYVSYRSYLLDGWIDVVYRRL